MKKDININVHHLTRVEGHGNIRVNVKSGKIEKCEWQVPEAPRFFEAMIRGRHYSEVARITSGICGICSVGHTLASIRGTECALGINETWQTNRLRTLLKHAENFDSHILHIYFLIAPDLLGAPSVFPLVATHGEVVARALKLKRLGHEWGAALAGRTTHPTTAIPGGFSKLPTEAELKALKEKMVAAVPDLEETIKTVASLAPNIPAFNRPTEYMALAADDHYAVYDGEIQTVLPDGDKKRYSIQDYKSVTNEWVSPQSTAKFCKNRLDSYAAGALARFNNNYEFLHPNAKALAETLGMSPVVGNPYLNSAAQLIEVVHAVYDSLEIIDQLLSKGINSEELQKPTKYSTGAGAVEVPRGILFHEYTYDKEGICVSGNCIIPTNQNHANIQMDFDALVPELLEQNKSEAEMELALEMLVRAYDPCISCSTHFLKVEFVN
ncbi:MAG: Ni/Fe hydrogenase subunit alpha [Bdellovibrionales bacterium]|nr:Ni/Fe hydrogenase subunit alpha [Bdellovibrionales bacterium]